MAFARLAALNRNREVVRKLALQNLRKTLLGLSILLIHRSEFRSTF
jgi:hypothetical protein